MNLTPLAQQIQVIEKETILFGEALPHHHPIHKICAAAASAVAAELHDAGFRFSSPAESQIEEIFGTAVWAYFHYVAGLHVSIVPAAEFDLVCRILAGEGADPEHRLTTSQYQIQDMRVDFCFAGKNWRTGKVFRLVVECDGHDFHERTKEQAAKDRARDRALQGAGYNIFRFTGSEIWRDPIGCVEQVVEWLDHKSCEKP